MTTRPDPAKQLESFRKIVAAEANDGYRDGMVTLLSDGGVEFPAVLEGTPWTTSWVSVLPVGRFDRWPRKQLLVCRSTNHPDDYRHLLSCLRLGNLYGAADGILGPR